MDFLRDDETHCNLAQDKMDMLGGCESSSKPVLQDLFKHGPK